MEVKNTTTPLQVTENKLARQIRNLGLQDRARKALYASRASRDTSSGNSFPTINKEQSDASCGAHPAASPPHSAACATVQAPVPLLGKRSTQRTMFDFYVW